MKLPFNLSQRSAGGEREVQDLFGNTSTIGSSIYTKYYGIMHRSDAFHASFESSASEQAVELCKFIPRLFEQDR